MGLDIYVGPLTRYYAGTWETSLETWSRDQGQRLITYRADGYVAPSVEEIQPAINAWRSDLQVALGDRAAGLMDWPESAGGAYATKQVGHDGRAGVIALAALQEFPDMRRPARVRHDPDADALVLRALRQPRPSRGLRLRSLARRANRQPDPGPDPAESPFDEIYRPQLWLPVTLPEPVAAGDVFGRPIWLGSVVGLRRQLEDVRARIRGQEPALLDAWKSQRAPGSRDFAVDASRGLDWWLELAVDADGRRMPMIIDQ